MSDRILVPLPDGRWLALSPQTFVEALAAGAASVAAAPSSPGVVIPEPLLDSKAAAAAIDVTARWLEDGARAGIVPHHRFGRFVRFRVSDVAAHFAHGGAPLP
jgi:hypothetical protein